MLDEGGIPRTSLASSLQGIDLFLNLVEQSDGAFEALLTYNAAILNPETAEEFIPREGIPHPQRHHHLGEVLWLAQTVLNLSYRTTRESSPTPSAPIAAANCSGDGMANSSSLSMSESESASCRGSRAPCPQILSRVLRLSLGPAPHAYPPASSSSPTPTLQTPAS